jgi:protein-S-isoprenylcysteine O-methyltransferase Ste14
MLIDEMERSGRWLFRYRNHLPLVLVPLVLLALGQAGGIESTFGTPTATVWKILCIAVVLAGLALRCLVVGYCPPGASGRNSQAHRALSLNRRGAYSMMRNPLYLANFLIIVGEVSLVEVWWLTLIVVLGFWLYYERIVVAEESFLDSGFGDQYRLWANATPAFIPDPRRWVAPRRAFSLKKVLANESPTLAQIVVVITLIQLACDWAISRQVERRGEVLIALSVISLGVYFALRAVRKKTRWLSTSPAGAAADPRMVPIPEIEPAFREE